MAKPRLKGLESLKAFRDSLPSAPPAPEKAVMGVVVPANGTPTPPDQEHLKFEVLKEGEGPQELFRHKAGDSMKKLAVMAMLGKTLATAIDEGQLVGELLEWLELKGHIQKNTKAHLQQNFFEERDR